MEQKPKRGRPPGKAKTGGRKPGTPNKITTNLRQAVNDLLDANWPTIEKDIKKLEPKDRLAFIEKMMSYTLPKLQSTTIDATIETSNRINQMNEDQLNRLIDNILNEEHGRIEKTID